METTIREARDWTTIVVFGAVDSASSPVLEAECRGRIEAGVRRLAIDLTEVFYMSSAGLRVLLSTLKLMAKQNGRLVLVGPHSNVKHVLDMSGFGRIFSIVAAVEQLPAGDSE